MIADGAPRSCVPGAFLWIGLKLGVVAYCSSSGPCVFCTGRARLDGQDAVSVVALPAKEARNRSPCQRTGKRHRWHAWDHRRIDIRPGRDRATGRQPSLSSFPYADRSNRLFSHGRPAFARPGHARRIADCGDLPMSIPPCDVPRGTGGRAVRGGRAPVFRPKIGP